MQPGKKHILILGGTGFIGSAFYEEIRVKNEYHIHLLIRTENKKPEPAENVTCYVGDLSMFDWNQLTHFPDAVFSLCSYQCYKR